MSADYKIEEQDGLHFMMLFLLPHDCIAWYYRL